jgi:amicyanin
MPGGYGQAPGYGAPKAPAAPAPAEPAAGEAARVSISGMRYGPAEVRVKAGATVTWTNDDTMPHSVTANDGSFDSGGLRRGQSYSRTFSEPGTYSYYCTYHPGMKGTVVVE